MKGSARNFPDCNNLSKDVEDLIKPYLEKSRCRVFDLDFGKPRARLYAVTVAAQLYRYFHEFESRAGAYEKSPGSPELDGAVFQKKPFLVVRSEHRCALEEALAVLKNNCDLSSFVISATDRLAIAEIVYPPLAAPGNGRASE